jgi:hypothetical protein
MHLVAASVARVFNIPATTISYRMRVHGINAVAAATMPHRVRDSVAAQARRLGLKPDTIRKRIKQKGLSLTEALSRPVARRRDPAGVHARAKAAGMHPSTVYRRIDAGMTVDEAVRSQSSCALQSGAAKAARSQSSCALQSGAAKAARSQSSCARSGE